MWQKIALLGAVGFLLWMVWQTWIVLIWYVSVSLISFAAYAWDKNRAINGNWRTPEKTLHLLDLLGGWPGGLLAQSLLRHKNWKPGYQRVFQGIVGLHIVVWIAVLVW